MSLVLSLVPTCRPSRVLSAPLSTARRCVRVSLTPRSVLTPTTTDERESKATTDSDEPDDFTDSEVSSEDEDDNTDQPSCDRCGALFPPEGSPDHFTPHHCLMCDEHLCGGCSEGSGESYACDECPCSFEDYGDSHSACRLCLATEIEAICCGCGTCLLAVARYRSM
jgi:hypothetical protein